ncbi:YitT family protein [Exiguobacterium sp. B2(2022)]|uniref:YitT family protein n=1 Tax=Exiguobacterium sp. B2(2022) TaxID=2992755 RepID=UPI00237A4B3C|nr:YitT family protein [Exiguobacterium sp. B2(2022)]MDE0562803.1 YitT family protein [Exiguobacterium sp. B2(2022)]
MRKRISDVAVILAAILVIGLAINLFLGPHDIAAGGVTGIGILLEEVLDIDRSIVVSVLNGLLLILTFVFLGKKVFYNTLLGSLFLPIALALIPKYMVTSDRFFSVVFGSILFAVAVAMLYRIGASSGGTTIPPLILHKYTGLNTAIGFFLTDALIVVSSVFVFGVESFLFAISSIILTSAVMAYIELGLDRKKAIFIMSESHLDDIKQALYREVDRGITVFDVRGGFQGENREMLMIVLTRGEYQTALKAINAIDKQSFMIVYNVADVHGLGFSYQPRV